MLTCSRIRADARHGHSQLQSIRKVHYLSRASVSPRLRPCVSCNVQQKDQSKSKTTQGWGQKTTSNPSEIPAVPVQEKWDVFNASAYNRPFTVPWGPWTTGGGMALWFISFAGVGFLLVPFAYGMLGIDIFELPPEGKALFTLCTQVTSTATSLLIIRGLTYKPLKESPSPELFNYDLSGPFSKPNGWAIWALGGIVICPFLVGGLATLLEAVGYESVGGRGTVDAVSTMIDIDLSTYLSLLTVTGVLAPVLEETVFRGFLLTSLTKVMPTWAAVGTSSLAFAMCHLSIRDFPMLTGLGMLLGFSYVRSRNLLTPMMIHGVWNSGVLTILFFLTASGVDIQEMLHAPSS